MIKIYTLLRREGGFPSWLAATVQHQFTCFCQWGRLEHLEETYVCRTCRLHTERLCYSQKQSQDLLVTVLTTLPPCCVINCATKNSCPSKSTFVQLICIKTSNLEFCILRIPDDKSCAIWLSSTKKTKQKQFN